MREPDRIIRLETVLPGPGCPGPPSTARSPRAAFPPQIKIGVNGAGWRDPTSTAESPTPWRGARARPAA